MRTSGSDEARLRAGPAVRDDRCCEPEWVIACVRSTVQSVTVNFAVGNATVRYDETQLEATEIKSAVRQRGHDAAAPAGVTPNEAHAGHAASAASAAAPAGDAQPEKAAAEKG